jgi:SanA protein
MKKFFYIILQWSIVILVVLVVSIFSIIKIRSGPFIKTSIDQVPDVGTAIVLGAGLLGPGELSPIFKDRVDIAVALYKQGKVATILVTGDDGTSTHNEVNPARDYLLSRNVPSGAIFLDHAGFDTYSSMYRAKSIFLVDSAVVVTQSFHLPRAVYVGRKLGIVAYGLPADQHPYSVKNNVRELFADVKAMYDVLSKRLPKYLGEEIPITGDSSESI